MLLQDSLSSQICGWNHSPVSVLARQFKGATKKAFLSGTWLESSDPPGYYHHHHHSTHWLGCLRSLIYIPLKSLLRHENPYGAQWLWWIPYWVTYPQNLSFSHPKLFYNEKLTESSRIFWLVDSCIRCTKDCQTGTVSPSLLFLNGNTTWTIFKIIVVKWCFVLCTSVCRMIATISRAEWLMCGPLKSDCQCVIMDLVNQTQHYRLRIMPLYVLKTAFPVLLLFAKLISQESPIDSTAGKLKRSRRSK